MRHSKGAFPNCCTWLFWIILECRDRALPLAQAAGRTAPGQAASTFRMGVRELQENTKKGVFYE